MAPLVTCKILSANSYTLFTIWMSGWQYANLLLFFETLLNSELLKILQNCTETYLRNSPSHLHPQKINLSKQRPWCHCWLLASTQEIVNLIPEPPDIFFSTLPPFFSHFPIIRAGRLGLKLLEFGSGAPFLYHISE